MLFYRHFLAYRRKIINGPPSIISLYSDFPKMKAIFFFTIKVLFHGEQIGVIRGLVVCVIFMIILTLGDLEFCNRRNLYHINETILNIDFFQRFLYTKVNQGPKRSRLFMIFFFFLHQ